MKAVIDSEVHITGASKVEVDAIMARARVKNPDLATKKRLQIPCWYEPETLPIYRWDGWTLVIPRGMAGWLCKEYPELQVDARRWLADPVEYRSVIMPRPYQSVAITTIHRKTQGVVVMPCGSGKTETGLAAIAEIGQPALWLTHTKDLLQQSMTRAEQRLGLRAGEIGVIGAGQTTLGSHITFATVQTLAQRDLSQIVDRFGVVIVDECHHCFANPRRVAMFDSVIRQLPARYRIGLTATAHRGDGLLETMYMILGPCIYELTQAELNTSGQSVTPSIHMAETTFETDIPTEPHIDFGQLLAAITADEERNRRIVDDLRQLLLSGRRCIVLGARVAHLLRLMQMLGDPRSRHISGQAANKVRTAALDDMRTGEARVLFASYNLAREGLDLPGVDTLILATPQRDPAIIQQAVGRIMRPAPGKDAALVIDYVDSAMPVCYWQARARRDLYTTMGCPITGWAPRNKRKEKTA